MRIEREDTEGTETYRVQVASFSRRDRAEDLRRKLKEKFSVPVVVRENPEAGKYQVQIGEFESRQAAQEFASEVLAEAGYTGSFVVREGHTSKEGEIKLALRGPQNLFRLSRFGYLFLPITTTSFLRLDGKPYRGIFDISINKSNRITIVNQLGIEEYLFGVVPAEISPTTYPEMAALAAQSIAARTYALKNMGRHRSEGFDLTADVRAQVYGGVALEKEAANESVIRTFGLALYYQGEPIDAMYTSTCGGKTEDFSNVFGGPEVPYLKSVFCTAEDNGFSLVGGTSISGKHALEQVLRGDDGSTVNRNIEFASVLGLIERKVLTSNYLEAPPTKTEIRDWVRKGCIAARCPSNRPFPRPSGDVISRAGFIRYAAEHLFGTQELAQRVSLADTDYYLGNLEDGVEVPAAARRALAFAMQQGLWRPYPDNSVRPGESVRRGDALSLIVRFLEFIRPEILRTGVFAGPAPSNKDDETSAAINVSWGNRTQSFHLARDLYLFRLADGRSLPVDNARVIGNERLRFHLADDGRLDFLELELNPTGASSDRYSPTATWRTTIARSAIFEKLRTLAGNIGRLVDLEPFRLGNSGRVVQIKLIGSQRSVVLNGYKFRNALGLKDTLFTISRIKNPDGTVESFTFNGRGWGHGVGLCQVGAFGMARSGRTYEEILKAYYQGVEIRKAY